MGVGGEAVTEFEQIYRAYFQDVDPKQAVEEQIMDAQQAMAVHRVLHDLPEPYKEVFSLRVFGQLSFGDIGSLFGRTANWACVTYHRARQKIRDEMGEYV